MKTLITRTALFLSTTFSLTIAQANNPATPLPDLARSLERDLGHQINRYVTYPLLDRSHDMDGEVYVSFVINTYGKVEVIEAHSDNTDLCEYVLRKLAKVDIGSNPGGLWKIERMRFVFRPEA